MHPTVARLLAHWRADESHRLHLNPGASSDRLDAFEARHGVRLPSALRDLYAATNGTGAVLNDTMLCLAPLDEVIPLRDYRSPCIDLPPGPLGWVDGMPWAKHWFLFADYLVSSHLFLIRLDADPANPGPVVGWDGGDVRWPIAPSIDRRLPRTLGTQRQGSLPH